MDALIEMDLSFMDVRWSSEGPLTGWQCSLVVDVFSLTGLSTVEISLTLVASSYKSWRVPGCLTHTHSLSLFSLRSSLPDSFFSLARLPSYTIFHFSRSPSSLTLQVSRLSNITVRDLHQFWALEIISSFHTINMFSRLAISLLAASALVSGVISKPVAYDDSRALCMQTSHPYSLLLHIDYFLQWQGRTLTRSTTGAGIRHWTILIISTDLTTSMGLTTLRLSSSNQNSSFVIQKASRSSSRDLLSSRRWRRSTLYPHHL